MKTFSLISYKKSLLIKELAKIFNFWGLLLSVFLFSTNSTKSAIGCMDNSKHANKYLGYDYKTPYYVKCACDCKNYQILARHGNRCSRCKHYRKPTETIIIKSLHR